MLLWFGRQSPSFPLPTAPSPSWIYPLLRNARLFIDVFFHSKAFRVMPHRWEQWNQAAYHNFHLTTTAQRRQRYRLAKTQDCVSWNKGALENKAILPLPTLSSYCKIKKVYEIMSRITNSIMNGLKAFVTLYCLSSYFLFWWKWNYCNVMNFNFSSIKFTRTYCRIAISKCMAFPAVSREILN